MFVPSLSWQIDHFCYKNRLAHKMAFSYLRKNARLFNVDPDVCPEPVLLTIVEFHAPRGVRKLNYKLAGRKMRKKEGDVSARTAESADGAHSEAGRRRVEISNGQGEVSAAADAA